MCNSVMTTFLNQRRIDAVICPYCQTKIKSKDEAIICPVCGTPHHIDCWKENGGCTTYGCSGKTEDIGHLTIEEIEKLKSPSITQQTEETPQNTLQQEFQKQLERTKKSRRRKIIPYISITFFAGLIIFSIVYTFIRINNYVSSEEYKISLFLSDWKSAWENKNLAAYESLLDNDYQYIEDNKPIKREERLRRLAASFKSNEDIKIKISDIKIKFDSTSTNYVNIDFIQKYTSGKISETGSKTMRLYRGESTFFKWKLYREYFNKF